MTKTVQEICEELGISTRLYYSVVDRYNIYEKNKSGRRYTGEELLELKAQLEHKITVEGKSKSKAAKELGIGTWIRDRIITDFGIPYQSKMPRITKEEREELANVFIPMYESGKGYKTIAEETGWAKSFVMNVCKEFGVKSRGTHNKYMRANLSKSMMKSDEELFGLKEIFVQKRYVENKPLWQCKDEMKVNIRIIYRIIEMFNLPRIRSNSALRKWQENQKESVPA